MRGSAGGGLRKIVCGGERAGEKQPGLYCMVKTLKNLLCQNQKSFDSETWHVVSGTQALQSLHK